MGLNDNNTVLQVSQQRQEEIQIHDQEQAQQQDQAAAQQFQEERQEQAEGQIAQPGQVQEEAAPAMEEQAQQQGMSRKERRSLRKQEARQRKQAEQARRKAEKEQQKAEQARRKAEQKEEKRREKAEKQQQKEHAKARAIADNAVADMKEKMQMQLTEAEKRKKPKLAEEIERYRIWYESSVCTAPLAPEVDALQQMVLAYIQDEAVGMPLFERLCALSAEAEEADHMRQEAFFRDMFTEDYLAINGKPIPVGLRDYLKLGTNEAYQKIEPIRQKVYGMMDEVTRHMTEDEQREAADEHGMLVGRGRTEYLKLVRMGPGHRFQNINDAKMNYARRAYQHGIGR